MALTDAQRAQVRLWLGYSDMGGASPSNLDGAMDALSAEAEVLVEDLLDRLDTLDTAMSDVATANRAGIVEVDNGAVKWASGTAASTSLAQQGRRLVGRLASILGVQVAADAFGSGVPTSGPCGRG